MLSETFGPVVRVRGLLGVCPSEQRGIAGSFHLPQSRVLYVHDIGALQHIANKDGFFYDEPKSAQAFVSPASLANHLVCSLSRRTNDMLLGPGLLTVIGT